MAFRRRIYLCRMKYTNPPATCPSHGKLQNYVTYTKDVDFFIQYLCQSDHDLLPLSAKQLTVHVTVQSDLALIGTGRQQ